MTKTTLEMIHNYLNGDDTVDLSILKAAIDAEWEKTTAKAKANADSYAEAFNVLMSVAGSEPHTVKELFAMTDAWPEGFTPSKLQYAITRMWTDTFEKIENTKSANQYKLR